MLSKECKLGDELLSVPASGHIIFQSPGSSYVKVYYTHVSDYLFPRIASCILYQTKQRRLPASQSISVHYFACYRRFRTAGKPQTTSGIPFPNSNNYDGVYMTAAAALFPLSSAFRIVYLPAETLQEADKMTAISENRSGREA